MSSCAGSGQPQQTMQAQPTPKRTWVVHKEYEFAVEVTSGPPTSVFCHTKASLLPGTVQRTCHHGMIAGKQSKSAVSALLDVLGAGEQYVGSCTGPGMHHGL